jgi:hypothetical protein
MGIILDTAMQEGLEDIAGIDGICDVAYHAARAPRPGAPELLIEIPHGATRRSDYEALRARLVGKLPKDLEQFFFVNTDIGAPEAGEHVAAALSGAGYGVLVLRCLVPRTFIDCNRVVLSGPPGAMIDGLTPAVAGYVTEAADRALLESMHAQYHELVARAYARICGRGGLALALHSYAPRSIEVSQVDENIVAALREAYEPAVYAKWRQRPAIDIICTATDGALLADAALVAGVREQYARIGVTATENATYKLHPATMGHRYAAAYPGQVICVEINRGLLAEPFMAFEESPIAPDKVRFIAAPLLAALREALVRRTPGTSEL